jgi:predicted RNA-binding protein
MGHSVKEVVTWFEEDLIVWPEKIDARRKVEIASTCRPELVHALYLWDTDWGRTRTVSLSNGFNVTCNGSFYRKEVLDYIYALHKWIPSYDVKNTVVVICPCAADKPYPAPLHVDIKRYCPEAYLIVCTGVLGLIPESLWSIAPNYDSGLPNYVRVEEEVQHYFAWKTHSHLIIYSDHYRHAFIKAAKSVGQKCIFFPLLGKESLSGYMPLRSEENLTALKKVYDAEIKEARAWRL